MSHNQLSYISNGGKIDKSRDSKSPVVVLSALIVVNCDGNMLYDIGDARCHTVFIKSNVVYIYDTP
jgi:hypothetical protein